MKFTKTLASVAAAALAVSSLAVSAFAAEPKLEAVTLDANGDKVIQWNVGVLGEAEITTIEVTGTASLGDGWVGGGGALGFDAIFADGTEDWTQVDYKLFNDDGTPTDNVVVDTETGAYVATLAFDSVKPNVAKAGAIAQLGWWWGSGDGTCAITDIKVNGTSVLGAFAPVTTVKKTQETESEIESSVIGLEAQFDKDVSTIGEWPSLPTTKFKADGSDVTLTYDFSQFGDPVKIGGNYVAIATDLEWADYDDNLDLYTAENVALKSIKFDGVEYGDYTKLALSNEAGGGTALRITLLNEWNDNFKGGNAPLSGIDLPEFTTLEITLAVTAPVEEEPEVPGETTEPVEPVEPGETETPSEILPGESSGTPINPDSGVAVTVIPAALAAAALATTGIVLKKRSK